MSNEIHKVLIIAFLEKSREAAYEISTELKKFGYGIDFAYAAPEETEEGEEQQPRPESKIYADSYLTKHMDLVMYDGIVFIDDGGDANASRVIAKRANEAGLALGGYGFGCQTLYEAKALKDKYVAAGLPKEFCKGNDVVNAPAVRAENVVTSAGNCPTGFAFLMVDALGGEVKRQVESQKEGAAPIPHSALVVSKMTRWADHWKLAEKLAESNRTLLIADWQDLDIASKTIQQFLVVGPNVKNKVAFIERPYCIPDNVWMKQASIKTADSIHAVNILKSIGCSMDTDFEDEDVKHLRSINRELRHQNIWPAENNKLAFRVNDKVELKNYNQAIQFLKAEINFYIEKFKDAYADGDNKAKMYARLARRNIFKLRLVCELKCHKEKMDKLSSTNQLVVKTADYSYSVETPDSDGDYEYGKGTVPGPYSNVNMPSRVQPWHQGDDWLEDLNGLDEQTIANLDRYHPDSKDGFYAEFDLWHSNDPMPWEDVEKGEGNYPLRSQY